MGIILTDTHSHIYLEEFDDDRAEVVLNSLNQGVKYIFLPNVDSSSVDNMLALAKKYPERIFPMIGLHPSSVEDDYQEEYENIISYLGKEKFCAIGEIGLDYYWSKTFKSEQKEIFEKQLKLAIENKLPAIIHVRDAFDDVIEILNKPEYDNLTGILHCFTGNLDQAKSIIARGLKLGIGGIVTFKNAGLDKVVEQISLNDIVLETDAPYLAPMPKRGKRNESTYLRYIAKKVAEIKQVSLEEVAETTTKNAETIFGLSLD